MGADHQASCQEHITDETRLPTLLLYALRYATRSACMSILSVICGLSFLSVSSVLNPYLLTSGSMLTVDAPELMVSPRVDFM